MNSQPYPGFNPDELHDYVFVPLPTLRRHNIVRQMMEFDEEEDEEAEEDEDEEEEGEDWEGEDEDGEKWGQESGIRKEPRKGEGEREDMQDVVNIKGANATVHIKPFSGFPILEHHAHPFFVIYNAIPKLQKHLTQLSPEYITLWSLITKINVIWQSRLLKALSSSKLKRQRGPGDEPTPDDDDDAHDDQPKRKTRRTAERRDSGLPGADHSKTRETRGRADKGKGKAAQRGKTIPAQGQGSRYPTPSPTSPSSTAEALRDKVFLFDDPSEVAAWAEAVATAGPPEIMDETVVWSDKESVRPPIREWKRWHVPYNQPKEFARFCSSDWPMYFYSFALWMPSNKQ